LHEREDRAPSASEPREPLLELSDRFLERFCSACLRARGAWTRCFLSCNTRKNREKSTKTDAVKHVPVHPVLAEWKLGGLTERMGARADGG